MINKILFVGFFIMLGAVVMYEHQQNEKQNQMLLDKIKVFMNTGPRFTATDGKELCEFIKLIAQNSYGYKDSGLGLPDCDKYLKVRE